MFTKIYNIWRQTATRQQGTHDGYMPFFDNNDNFSLKWAKAISESPSATSCLSTLIDFMEGYGFSDNPVESKYVNQKGETFFQIHQKTVREFAQNEGFYWLLRYSADGKITEWEVLSFENCRLGKPDDNGYIGKIYYNPFFGTDEYYSHGNKKKTKIYDVFNPMAVKSQILEQGNAYKGQVYFFGTTSVMSRFYPINEAYACIKWMKIEPGVSTYHEENINNGFLQTFMLLMKGDPNAPSTNPDLSNTENPITVAEEFDQVVSENFMGAKRNANMFVQWVNNGDEKPEILPMPTNANGDLFITLDNQATKKITVAWKVPGVLANIQEGVSLGGDANQIRVAVKLMQQRVIKKQRILTDCYLQILKLFTEAYDGELTIVQYNPYPELNTLDDKIWMAMTLEEQRQWIQDNTEIDLGITDNSEAVKTLNYKNAVPVAFPDKVIKKVKSALDYIDKMQLDCGGKAGRDVANNIVNNKNMGYKQLKRIYNYLKAREQYANSLNNEGCEVILYNSWGGIDMFNFLDGKIKELDSWLN